MEDLASEFATLLPFGTPWLVLGKLLRCLAMGRFSLARRGSSWTRGELVTWLLVATLDSRSLALWSGIANQPEDVCEPTAWEPTPGVRIESSSLFYYPVTTHCVWPDGHTMSLVPWQLNAATLLLFTVTVAVFVRTAVRAHRHRSTRRHTVR
ncbi:hypothetical protein SAMN04487820_101184 [Actinopolyspora mzabensis]|uniref:Uncharacterized protein n=1 Tax=Actinopolyspora mzabensis TaxID=995066 RepID=A0A1G8VM49_ACTMZ|nr:hypothetical protein [Actinopolyspora mzabensis]SDJ67128.1 hypothetical protein SAMN04487820_101184 [Actinopolyspora mzabensis]